MFTGPADDRQAIAELAGVYADGVVAFDVERWGSTWADDASWDMMGHLIEGKAAITEFWLGAMSGFEAVSFISVPCAIEISGDTAKARLQTQEILKSKDGTTRHVGGLYEDELIKQDGRWLYSKRVFGIVAEYQPPAPAPAMAEEQA